MSHGEGSELCTTWSAPLRVLCRMLLQVLHSRTGLSIIWHFYRYVASVAHCTVEQAWRLYFILIDMLQVLHSRTGLPFIIQFFIVMSKIYIWLSLCTIFKFLTFFLLISGEGSSIGRAALSLRLKRVKNCHNIGSKSRNLWRLWCNFCFLLRNNWVEQAV